MAELVKQEGAEKVEWLIPPASVLRSNDGVSIELEVPGLDRKEITVAVQNQELTIQGACASRDENQDALIQERSSACYRRQFVLSPDLDAENLEATLEDGVLQVYIPKAESAKPRQIQIH